MFKVNQNKLKTLKSKIMKKTTYTTMLLALAMTFSFFFTGCNKEEMIEQPVVQETEMIPIAKITTQNDIQHLFLQKDMRESFKDSPEIELVFMEVVDDKKTGENAGLLYRIYNREQGVTTTTLMTSVLTLKGDIYYYDPLETRGGTITCSTSSNECSRSATDCIPKGTACTKCSSWTDTKPCTKSITAPLPDSFIADVIRSAVSVY